MALPASGPISSSQIATELVVSSTNFSANSAELVGLTDLNTLSISSSGNILNIDTPNSMSEWYNYTHNFKVSSSIVTSSIGLKAPYTASYPFTTYAQVEMGTTSSLFIFTGSNFISSGIAPTASVPFSIYYATYSLSMSASSTLLKTGVLLSGSSSDKLNYTYLPASGSIVTFLFKTLPTASAAATTTAYLKYDQVSSSLTASSGVWANIGTGGSTYNLKAFNTIVASGSGNATFLNFNTGSVKNQYMTASGINIGAKDFSVSTVFRLTKFYDSSSVYFAGEILNIFDSTTTGFEIVTGDAATTNSLYGTVYFCPFRSGSSNPTSAPLYGFKFPDGYLNRWVHFTYLFNSTSSNSSLYLNTTLVDTFLSGSNSPQNMTGTPLKINVGMANLGSYFPVGMHLAALLVWTGSILTPAQITTLNNEYDARYSLYYPYGFNR